MLQSLTEDTIDFADEIANLTLPQFRYRRINILERINAFLQFIHENLTERMGSWCQVLPFGPAPRAALTIRLTRRASGVQVLPFDRKPSAR